VSGLFSFGTTNGTTNVAACVLGMGGRPLSSPERFATQKIHIRLHPVLSPWDHRCRIGCFRRCSTICSQSHASLARNLTRRSGFTAAPRLARALREISRGGGAELRVPPLEPKQQPWLPCVRIDTQEIHIYRRHESEAPHTRGRRSGPRPQNSDCMMLVRPPTLGACRRLPRQTQVARA